MSHSIEDIYRKKTHIEHMLSRPEGYIGSIAAHRDQYFVYLKNEIVCKEINCIPGLYKIFDEILVNAVDNYTRDNLTSEIRVNIDRKEGTIQIWNNGKSIDVTMHKTYKIYVPELVFGHLLTSSNYDDDEKKLTGGRNGYGAKATNIFSSEFRVDVGDSRRGKRCIITWKNNMSEMDGPHISDYKGSDYTSITFKPDFSIFKINSINNDMQTLFTKRVFDVAGILPTVKVYMNNNLIKNSGFCNYIQLFSNELYDRKPIYHRISSRWEIGLGISKSDFKCVSFVNGISTVNGGTHVQYILNQLVSRIIEILSTKHKNIEIKPNIVKKYMIIWINSFIINPTFNSLTKDRLETNAKAFGSVCKIPDTLIRRYLENGFEDCILAETRSKINIHLSKSLSAKKNEKIFGIPKLDDALLAGTNKSSSCTLILTEGDSAKALAMAGLEVIGREKYGVYPLKGKLLNVREAAVKQLTENEEIQNIVKILGLQMNKIYKDISGLRYGSLMIMADQDDDGSHIKGLIINLIHYFWPSLLKLDNFLFEFITPIVKVFDTNSVEHSFFTVADYNNWMQTNKSKIKRVKYYKGLGTSTSKEAKEYFSNLKRHVITFKYNSERCSEAIKLAFAKEKADERKRWMNTQYITKPIDHNLKSISYEDFINKEFVHFSIADTIRSIPSVVDGLKPGQRKILFSCFKRKLNDEIKVAQLCGYVAEHSAYHHGELSLSTTMVKMAQDFVGSNNLNLLQPIGQFGTRNHGGKDSASSRYIYTNLSKLTRLIYNEKDDPLLNYLIEDNCSIEPDYYAPIIPMILVNGSEGIGTGWSTYIPMHSPFDIISNFKKKLKGGEFEELIPWYKDFKGYIELDDSGAKYITKGCWEEYSHSILIITELPIGTWTKNYSEFLESEIQKGNLGIKTVYEKHTSESLFFELHFEASKLKALVKSGEIEKKLKLTSKLNITNMVLFDSEGKLMRYTSTTDIMKEFFKVRMQYYIQRKAYLLSVIEKRIADLKTKTKFINAILAKIIVLGDMEVSIIAKQVENNEIIEKDSKLTLNDLLNMPLMSLTKQKLIELQSKLEEQLNEYNILKNLSEESLWLQDLDTLENAYKDYLIDKESNIKAKINKPTLKIKLDKEETNKKIHEIEKFHDFESIDLKTKVKKMINQNKKAVEDEMVQLTLRKRPKLIMLDDE